MATSTTRTVARLLWFFPALMLFLTINQAKVARDLGVTLDEGRRVAADVVDVHKENRVDVTYDYVDLRIPLADGRVLERNKLSLPHALIQELEGVSTLEVSVLPGAAQEVVITSVGPTQRRIAAMNAGVCLVAFLLFTVGVFQWNRLLARKGDPAQRMPAAVPEAG